MPVPTSPVIEGLELFEVVYAKDQPQYQPLPVLRSSDGSVVSRWRLSWKERFKVFFSGDIYLFVSTFNQPLQPVLIEVDKPKLEQEKE